MLDYGLVDLYHAFYFLKREIGFSTFEMEELMPYELEIYYYMALRDFKRKMGFDQQ